MINPRHHFVIREGNVGAARELLAKEDPLAALRLRLHAFGHGGEPSEDAIALAQACQGAVQNALLSGDDNSASKAARIAFDFFAKNGLDG